VFNVLAVASLIYSKMRMEPPELILLIGAVLREIPAPTQSWADIIGHISWPIMVLFLILRFRAFLRTFLQTLADRLVTDDVKIGPFELTANSEVLVLDANELDPSSEFTGDDVTHIEALFEFMGEKGNEARISQWLNENGLQTLDIVDFLTEAIYADRRAEAYKALILRG